MQRHHHLPFFLIQTVRRRHGSRYLELNRLTSLLLYLVRCRLFQVNLTSDSHVTPTPNLSFSSPSSYHFILGYPSLPYLSHTPSSQSKRSPNKRNSVLSAGKVSY